MNGGVEFIRLNMYDNDWGAEMKIYYVYILSSDRGTLYTGVTNNIRKRVLTHKRNDQKCFTSKYKICRLIYYEETRNIQYAIGREKEIKGWRRSKKLQLIRSVNSEYKDLSRGWYIEGDFLLDLD